MINSRLYIGVREEVPSYIVPVLVAHTILNADTYFLKVIRSIKYEQWKTASFKKCLVSLSDKEYNKVNELSLPFYQGFENNTLHGAYSCIIVEPQENENIPKVLKFAKLWKP